jgi:glycosyltransferase involved in cell wall biosynthesis
MAKQRLLIDWPLTPYTGWGGYGIQLAQALVAKGSVRPVLTRTADRSPHCDPHWILKLDEIERFSRKLIEQLETNPQTILSTNCQVAMGPIGNQVPPLRVLAKHQVGVTFFERSQIDESYRLALDSYDLVITGSHWNQRVMEEGGYGSAVLVHQGVDTSRFNPIPVPRLFEQPFIIFAGGKLEARKGQDIVLEGFRRFLRHCPNALLIATWANIGNVGLDTIARTPYVEGAPSNGDAKSLFDWLQLNQIPAGNILLPQVMANTQLPNLIKQTDAAVFTSRCEGGTNLMAMETLACGIPTLLSANTGHLDLLEMGMAHAISVGSGGVGKVPKEITTGYGGDAGGLWGETDPEELVEWWLRLWKEKQTWRHHGQQGAGVMATMNWQTSMEKLIQLLLERELLRPS